MYYGSGVTGLLHICLADVLFSLTSCIALCCMKGCHDHRFEIMTSEQKSSNAYLH